jgi:hypothetical protein
MAEKPGVVREWTPGQLFRVSTTLSTFAAGLVWGGVVDHLWVRLGLVLAVMVVAGLLGWLGQRRAKERTRELGDDEEDVTILAMAVSPQFIDRVQRLGEKAAHEGRPTVEPPHLICASLAFMEWAVDRQSEGLHIAAVAELPPGAWRPSEPREPWQ